MTPTILIAHTQPALRCLSFASGRRGYIQSDPFAIMPSGSISVAAWFKTTYAPKQYVVSKMAGTIGWGLHTTSYLYWYLGRTNRVSVRNETPVTDGRWHFVVATYDGTVIAGGGTAASGTRLYVDGAQQSVVVDDNLNLTNVTTADVPTDFGAYNSSGTPGSPFIGRIAKVGIWESVLSAGQVAALYSSRVVGADWSTTEPSGYWELNSPVSATDMSGNGRNVTMVGMTDAHVFREYPGALL